MSTMRYVPVLKAKSAEIEALCSLPTGTRDVIPLFEVQAVLPPVRKPSGEWVKHRSAAAEVASFLDQVHMYWNALMMVDISRAAQPSTRAAWWSLLHATETIRSTGATLLPVVRLDDPVAALAAASLLATKGRGAAVRVMMPTNLATLAAGLPAVAAQLGIAVNRVIVLLDWGLGLEDTVTSLDDAERETRAAIRALPQGHGPVVTLGTPDTAEAKQEGYWTFTRREWWLWLRVRSGLPALWYGDYALFAPSAPAPVSPKYGYLRYSSNDLLHIWREAPPATGGGKGGAYQVCCQKAIVNPAFCGSAFSPADHAIDGIASGRLKTSGLPQVWRVHALTHHFYLVRSQLAAPPSAPPAGTH